ncbi:MAG TPA: dihydropteroate synthase [Gemmatimonadales bacterium]|nr:dihydropteroate synthase [Gemmatimonadales bacterium]
MNVVPLATHSVKALRDTLRGHGWDAEPAEAAASGAEPIALHLTGLEEQALEALVQYAGRLGLDVHTGDDWAVLSGTRWRLGTFARPWTAPPALAEVATRVGLAIPADPGGPSTWLTARGPVPLHDPMIIGILNVTPDSFSDGGRYRAVDAARTHGDNLVAAGARAIDVGGESTRPGREAAVAADEELARVLPVIRALVKDHPDLLISIDTVKAEVARAALAEGAALINDVTAFRFDPRMAAVAAEGRAGVVLMHSRGGITEIASYVHAEYGGDVTAGVLAELAAAVAGAVAQGVAPEAVVVDPGLGFSKTPEQSALLCDRLAALRALGRPILVGPSRKRFVGALAGIDAPAERDRATAVTCALAWERGARLFRVHDVAATREALAVARGIGG